MIRIGRTERGVKVFDCNTRVIMAMDLFDNEGKTIIPIVYFFTDYTSYYFGPNWNKKTPRIEVDAVDDHFLYEILSLLLGNKKYLFTGKNPNLDILLSNGLSVESGKDQIVFSLKRERDDFTNAVYIDNLITKGKALDGMLLAKLIGVKFMADDELMYCAESHFKEIGRRKALEYLGENNKWK